MTIATKRELRETLPRKVKVGAYTFRQFVVETSDVALKDGDQPAALGMTDLQAHTIHYDRSMPVPKFLNIVFHELQHAINDVYGIDDEETEEHVAERSANGWMQVFMDNPSLLAWLNRAIKQVKKEAK